ncbi:NmrA family transcriptional regulator [Sphaerisporangium siamense]|uniref:Uncharacterized protein YbjT (DUF2867 family) n=1 Tax=Sphaerisporangium siamense TaxID=795645 RepID=A0A7W7GCA5_9ACTN|nr:NmrA/HSCARG family protein [Sphaerisporangium siamense]MBB4704362.1 uncharacterized protein YbjT (DUF2867 family) [Sphaerisporangium siamense]GII84957.1 NmrA family transcriptional regulator [Sphaerisporangium siamense]
MGDDRPVLVTGATGRQGGAVARALLDEGVPVRALVRDPRRAAHLAGLGAELAVGDLNDPASLKAAATGARGVFSVQTLDLADVRGDAERVHGRNLVEAAREAGVGQFVHTSVSGAGDSRPEDGPYMRHYSASKAYVGGLLRQDGGFASWTELRPAFFMENFIRPSFLFANGVEDRFLTALRPETRLSLIAVRDIGTAAAAAFRDPAAFHGAIIELAGDRLSMTEIAAVLSEVWGTTIEPPDLTPEQALAQGLPEAFVRSQEWMNEGGNPARPEHTRAFGLPTTTFRAWATSTA